MNLEEEIDQLKVQASVDRATIEELTSCLQQEREGILLSLINMCKIITFPMYLLVFILACLLFNIMGRKKYIMGGILSADHLKKHENQFFLSISKGVSSSFP